MGPPSKNGHAVSSSRVAAWTVLLTQNLNSRIRRGRACPGLYVPHPAGLQLGPGAAGAMLHYLMVSEPWCCSPHPQHCSHLGSSRGNSSWQSGTARCLCQCAKKSP